MDSDSDFYGDENTISSLEARVKDFDVIAWWDRRTSALDHFQLASHKPPSPPIPASCPHDDPEEGQLGAKRLSESVEEFLGRLPPATTNWRPGLDWIRISNPFASPQPDQALARFRKGAEERLALFAEFKRMATAASVKAANRSLMTLRRDISEGRRETIADLLELAGACNVVAGKWMLFPGPEHVNEVWTKVATATANGELGITAKVETRVRADKERLVCIYTRDFRDKDDVRRVLNRMRELELVRPGGRQIYYKPDAWTELGIYGGNGWGIAASMYSSNEIFGYTKTVPSRFS
ncbi:uncharacterized protein P884DRAFT_275773 [Thermothelomyces heterothallicus CBS 202.75]|uniref:uncharacterized protein n=1 Tax=Thermothelomyces heterothallicus CBS 202.75 TaxID=1149848 RepID=UPI003744781B